MYVCLVGGIGFPDHPREVRERGEAQGTTSSNGLGPRPPAKMTSSGHELDGLLTRFLECA
jgi:hypothetical protein